MASLPYGTGLEIVAGKIILEGKVVIIGYALILHEGKLTGDGMTIAAVTQRHIDQIVILPIQNLVLAECQAYAIITLGCLGKSEGQLRRSISIRIPAVGSILIAVQRSGMDH